MSVSVSGTTDQKTYLKKFGGGFSPLSPPLDPPMDLTREWNKRMRWIRHLQKSLINPWFRKHGVTLANFIVCYQTIFGPKNLSLKFRHIYTDDHETYCIIFH